MMKRSLTILLLSTILATVLCPVKAADPPKAKSIVWPDVPIPVPPAPTPATPIVLSPDLIFVIQSDNPLIVVASPQGVVNVTADTGPLKVRGKFVDAPTAINTRTLSAKFIYFVDPATLGTCELLAWEVGSTDATTVQRRTIQVSNVPSPGPIPGPPGPTPPGPIPGPPAKTPPVQPVQKKAALPAYPDAWTQAMAQHKPLVVWVNCAAPTQQSDSCVFTTALAAWDSTTPRIVVSLYDENAQLLYWVKDYFPGATATAIETEVQRLQKPAVLKTEVAAPRVTVTRSC